MLLCLVATTLAQDMAVKLKYTAGPKCQTWVKPRPTLMFSEEGGRRKEKRSFLNMVIITAGTTQTCFALF